MVDSSDSIAADDAIKLIIWDLDETFWNGTLAEGEITPIAAHIGFVKELCERGIMQSIVSKNDFATARDQLIGLGVWDYFIFPRIAFLPKGALVREVIEAAQLRAPSVLFIDDNPMNLQEALHYNPGLQLAGPETIPELAGQPRCKGRPDPERKRLSQYKILEQKSTDQARAGGDNLEFLRQSGIRVSFHYDIQAQFPRIHELVNRTNQLNFTKRRWPEAEALARACFETELNAALESVAGYIKVADRYGNYGICGFFLIRIGVLQHFAFSCRAMNMGVEQFVWNRLGRPKIAINGEVASALDDPPPDWITLADDAGQEPQVQASRKRLVICARGSCDLAVTTHYLRAKYDIIEEFNYRYEGWTIFPTARAAAIADELRRPECQALLAQTPGIPDGRFESAIHTGAADVYVLSFSAEIYGGLKRSRSTGLVLPLHLDGATDFADLTYDELRAKRGDITFGARDWAFLQAEYEIGPFLNAELLTRDLHAIFSKLQGKRVIVLLLNEKVGSSSWILERCADVNRIVRPAAEEFGCELIELNALLRGVEDLESPDDPGIHYNRRVYMQLADHIAARCAAYQSESA
jgi:FkbH-like protein